jgi:hypothetical protein
MLIYICWYLYGFMKELQKDININIHGCYYMEYDGNWV